MCQKLGLPHSANCSNGNGEQTVEHVLQWCPCFVTQEQPYKLHAHRCTQSCIPARGELQKTPSSYRLRKRSMDYRFCRERYSILKAEILIRFLTRVRNLAMVVKSCPTIPTRRHTQTRVKGRQQIIFGKQCETGFPGTQQETLVNKS